MDEKYAQMLQGIVGESMQEGQGNTSEGNPVDAVQQLMARGSNQKIDPSEIANMISQLPEEEQGYALEQLPPEIMDQVVSLMENKDSYYDEMADEMSWDRENDRQEEIARGVEDYDREEPDAVVNGAGIGGRMAEEMQNGSGVKKPVVMEANATDVNITKKPDMTSVTVEKGKPKKIHVIPRGDGTGAGKKKAPARKQARRRTPGAGRGMDPLYAKMLQSMVG